MVGSWCRLGGVLGIAFVVAWVLGMAAKGVTPVFDDRSARSVRTGETTASGTSSSSTSCCSEW
jgi:hypothetical protein